MLKFPSKPDGPGRAAHSCRSPYPDFGMTSSGLRPLPGLWEWHLTQNLRSVPGLSLTSLTSGPKLQFFIRTLERPPRGLSGVLITVTSPCQWSFQLPSRFFTTAVMITKFNLSSTVRLASGYTMPLLGFGVYQANDAKASVLEALKAGYRSFDIIHW